MDKRNQRFGGRGNRGQIGELIKSKDPCPAVPQDTPQGVNMHKLHPVGCRLDERRSVRAYLDQVIEAGIPARAARHARAA